ncbi:uncharacterized protein LOC129582021 [Paramacrobiotus metropolitanus]|uniref:uncharacterized protein LOC129582021 n=1 Tax=Paramacrobiotus metropolitanus TaxID=2943436 RepID=UPI00244622F7|nr:uncharacterized protein LOC129582021 [Paramacrobiotus metropolitanus]
MTESVPPLKKPFTDFVLSVVDPTGTTIVQILPLESYTSLSVQCFSVLDIVHLLEQTRWDLDCKWQSAGYIHRVISDLHHRQLFTFLHLVYLAKLRLLVILGKEPPLWSSPSKRHLSHYEMPEEKRAKHEAEPATETQSRDATKELLNNTLRSRKSVYGTPVESSSQHAVQENSVDESISEREKTTIVAVIPGNSRTAGVSGSFRKSVREELTTVKNRMEAMGFLVEDGWLLAITDAEDVAYYVEKSITLSNLMEATQIDGTRDTTFSAIFGTQRGVNVRTVARKDERKTMKKQYSERKLSSERTGLQEAGFDPSVPERATVHKGESEMDVDGKYCDMLDMIE